MHLVLDEDLNPLVAEIARGLGLDVSSVHELESLLDFGEIFVL